MAASDNESLEERNSSSQKQHWGLAFVAGMVFTSLMAIATAGVYLFYLDAKLKHLVQFQEQYFEQQFTSFSNKLINQLHDDLSKQFEGDLNRMANDLQKRLAERGQQFTQQATEQLAQADKEIQKTLSQSSENLIANIPTAIRAKLLEDRQTETSAALKGVELAENLLRQGNPARATLFFSNALNKDPGNISILNRYATSVFDWSRQQTGEGDLTVSLDVINETDRFLQNQAGSVAPQDISKLEELIVECDQVKEEIQDKILVINQAISLDSGKELNSKIEKLLAVPIPTEEFPLSQHIDELQSAQNTIVALSDANPVISDELKNNLSSRLKTAEIDLNALSILQQLGKNGSFEVGGVESNSQGNVYYRMTALNAVAQQLTILQPTASPEISKRIDLAFTRISSQIEELDRQQAKAAWEKISLESEKVTKYMKVTQGIYCRDALQELLAFQRFCAINSEKISSQTYRDQIDGLTTKVGQAISAWSTAQGLRYDIWALNKLETFNSQYKKEIGMWWSDSEKLYSVLLSNLGGIDSRFLSPPAARAYNEVFEFFYKELKSDQKIKISSAMAIATKTNPQEL